MTAPSPPSTTSDLEAARHLIGLGEGFGTGRAARRLQGERATARRQWDDAEAALRTALSTAQEIGSPAQLWKTHAAFTRLYAGQGKADESERARRAARHVLESVRERLQNPGLRQSLAVLIRQALS
jgi:hypothetical protein